MAFQMELHNSNNSKITTSCTFLTYTCFDRINPCLILSGSWGYPDFLRCGYLYEVPIYETLKFEFDLLLKL